MPILKELHERTGYVGAVILAAPDGARGGELSTVRLVNLAIFRYMIKLTSYQLIHRANRTPAGLGSALQKGAVERESRDAFVGICVPCISSVSEALVYK